MKYKVGDKVTLTNGNIMTIDQIDDISKWYRMKEDPWNCYTDEMIEGLVEKKISIKLTGEAIKNNEMVVSVDEYILPEGYIIKDENGNVINARKVVLEKKKKEYPKTYEECCKVLNVAVRDLDILDNMLDTTEIIYSKNLDRLLNSFRKLLICRDAYWKIAGAEMGLGKPWEPDWSIYEHKFCLGTDKDKVIEECVTTGNRILAFPTAEMRDAFYENFKELIESCKELL